jgi:hypothetical protein
VLPEAAGIVFGGGFPRRPSIVGKRSAQRLIFRVQRELERLAVEEGSAALVLCDRGTLDGAAYWPGDRASFFAESDTTLEEELARYAEVIHLRTPELGVQYNHDNPLRIESLREADAVDNAILDVWSRHPARHIIDSTPDFMEKARRAIALVRELVPECCRPRTTTPPPAWLTGG